MLKAHTRLYHSTSGLRVIDKKKKKRGTHSDPRCVKRVGVGLRDVLECFSTQRDDASVTERG